MKRFILHIFAALTLLAASTANAQTNTLPVRTVDGQQYHYYEVKEKETIYSISRQLGIDRAYIERYNPSVADGLRAGQVLYFPVTAESRQLQHTVADKETLYGIAHRYGVTVDQLKLWNPSAADGIRPGQKLLVSDPGNGASPIASVQTAAPAPAVATTPDDTPAPTGTIRYTIHDGESLYRIAVNHATTVDRILALNPGLDRNNYQAGTEILIPSSATTAADVAAAEPVRPVRKPVEASTMPVNPPIAPVEATPVATPDTTATPAQINTTPYRVGKHETFYSIARSNGITVEELEMANPTVGILKEGMVLNIPRKQDAADAGEATATGSEYGVETDPTAEAFSPTEVRIALMLPLMLNSSEQSKQAQLYTEFYKGFLMAVDSMRQCGAPIHIQAYDTEASSARIGEILATPGLEQNNVIVAPDSEAHLTQIGTWAAANGVDVLNLFVVKDETFNTNPHMMQGNIPHTEMYAKAVDGLTRRFAAYTPVILERNEGPDDKAEYIAALRARLDADGTPYRVIQFDGTLRASDLDALPTDGSYAFVPTSGKQAELNRIAPTLIEWSRTLTGADPIRLFGYPEWTTFRGETLVNMHKLNTLVYSRFYTVPDDPAVRDVENRFQSWYGTPMQNFVPRQGLFGFDTGMFLINALAHPRTDGFLPYMGVQNGFSFTRPTAASGWVNNELYFINFRPSGLIDKITL